MPGVVAAGRSLNRREASTSVREHLTLNLARAFKESATSPKGNYGVILASTKGISEDFIRSENPDLSIDPLTPLLDDVVKRLELEPKRSLCVSNACSSGLAALKLAEIWLRQGLDDVVIFAADSATKFVVDGFASLKLGFSIGDAACVIWVSNRNVNFNIRGVGLDSDGSIVTRPKTSGSSLERAVLKIPKILDDPPDLIFAHATGTTANEETEALVYDKLFPGIPRIGTKMTYGHTLGASAALDLSFACDKINNREAQKVLLSSLGFGGAHAAALVEAL